MGDIKFCAWVDDRFSDSDLGQQPVKIQGWHYLQEGEKRFIHIHVKTKDSRRASRKLVGLPSMPGFNFTSDFLYKAEVTDPENPKEYDLDECLSELTGKVYDGLFAVPSGDFSVRQDGSTVVVFQELLGPHEPPKEEAVSSASPKSGKKAQRRSRRRRNRFS